MNTVVIINGHRITLDQKQQLGAGGGEGNVFLARLDGGDVAVKIYHTPSPEREEKLSTFLAQNWNLPMERIALPLYAARAPKGGHVVGFAMPYMGTKFYEIARLANRRHRNASLISTSSVVRIFLDGGQTLRAIHRGGLVVGDFSDQNALYSEGEMLWIDVDSWQFASYACPVGTEDFLAPELYGLDLSAQPLFQPEHDWYAFAVHLFRSLLLAHPYGGVHPDLKSLLKRAQQRIFIMHSMVTYPTIAHPLELLNDELVQIFERIFAQGWRGPFPLAALQSYQSELIACSSCKQEYPQSRPTCPICHARTRVLVKQVSATGITMRKLLHTDGPIIFAKVDGTTLVAIAYEDGKVVLYRQTLNLSQQTATAQRQELFRAVPGTSYDLFEGTLLVNPPQSTTLYGIDITGEQPRGLFQVNATAFAGTRSVPFQAEQQRLYYMQSGMLFSATFEHGTLLPRPLRPVMEQQTWFTVASDASQVDQEQPTIFGFFQVFRQQLFWLMYGGASYDVPLAPLDQQEVQLDLTVHFSAQGALVRRFTQELGIDYLRTALLDTQGNILYQSGKIKREEYLSQQGQAYATGILLHPSDQGIIQEQIVSGACKTFSATQPYVQAGDTLVRYQSGVIVIQENRVLFLQM